MHLRIYRFHFPVNGLSDLPVHSISDGPLNGAFAKTPARVYSLPDRRADHFLRCLQKINLVSSLQRRWLKRTPIRRTRERRLLILRKVLSARHQDMIAGRMPGCASAWLSIKVGIADFSSLHMRSTCFSVRNWKAVSLSFRSTIHSVVSHQWYPDQMFLGETDFRSLYGSHGWIVDTIGLSRSRCHFSENIFQ